MPPPLLDTAVGRRRIPYPASALYPKRTFCSSECGHLRDGAEAAAKLGRDGCGCEPYKGEGNMRSSGTLPSASTGRSQGPLAPRLGRAVPRTGCPSQRVRPTHCPSRPLSGRGLGMLHKRLTLRRQDRVLSSGAQRRWRGLAGSDPADKRSRRLTPQRNFRLRLGPCPSPYKA